MSQIATLRIVPESSLAALCALVEPQKVGWFGRPRDVFWDRLHDIAPDVLNLDWSGYAVIVLFEFLREQHGFDFAAVDDHPLARILSNARRSYFAVFDSDVAGAFASKLATVSLSEKELAAFANHFSGTDDADAGKSLLGAAQSLQAGLAQVLRGSIGLLHVG
jgi:hypothetical protein